LGSNRSRATAIKGLVFAPRCSKNGAVKYLCLICFLAVTLPIASAERALLKLAPIADGEPFTFAVVGDYRGDSEGNPPPVLLEIFAAINRDAPRLVLSSGDLINGYPEEDEAQTRKLWAGYRSALRTLQPPIFHVPGNHDLFNEASTRLWTEMWGPTFYAFDCGGVRFIGLDTETTHHRVAGRQLEWLREQLASAGQRRVFIFFHQPLFPVDGHIGSSLDVFPRERDALHQLFVAHRDAIQGVFLGHEHLFDFERRDGVPYIISAGGGAPLYVPAEIGGFYHYLLVHVAKDGCTFEVKKIWRPEPAHATPRKIKPDELLESWETPQRFWNFWDQSVTHQLVTAPTSNGRQALKISFDPSHYDFPSVGTTFVPALDLKQLDHLKLDVFVPDSGSDSLSIKASLDGPEKSESAPIVLKRGWNTVDLDLNAKWLAPGVRSATRELQWLFAGPKDARGPWLVIDNMRAEGRRTDPALTESWENPIEWGAGDESVRPSIGAAAATDGKCAVRLELNFAAYARPRIFTALNPSWDLSEVDGLTLDVILPANAPDISIHLALTGELETVEPPPVQLRPGKNRVVMSVAALPVAIRKNVRRIECWFSSAAANAKTIVVLDQLRANESKR
jgi:predicted phosphodiesterase